MAYETKDNSGSLFKNDKKATANHPDYKGSAKIDGVDYWMDAWVKATKDGAGRWMSFSFKPKEQKQAPKNQERQAPEGFDDMQDDVPF